jgi:hypothetical protein
LENKIDYVKEFKNRIDQLTGNAYSYHRLREIELNGTIEISYRCFKYYCKCKSKCTVLLDLNNQIANIYQCAEKHNHMLGYTQRSFKVCNQFLKIFLNNQKN